MPIHPKLQDVLQYVREHPAPHPATSPIEERRAAHLAASLLTEAPSPEMASVRDGVIPTPYGEMPIRVYEPLDDTGAAIGVYFHGGGFVLGTLDSYDALARRLATTCRMTLVSVAYRLAPEHPFPAAIDDAVTALRYVAVQRASFGNRDAKMVVLGDSAGATLAAVACNLTQADVLPLAAQVLLYPTMGPEILTESVHDYGTGFFLEMEHLHFHYEEYLGEYHDHTDARITPLLADNLEQVPPAVIVVAECDPLRDEAVNYAGLLEHFGVDVELLEAEGMPHSFFKMGGVLPEALEDLDDLGRHVQNFVAAH